jgi:hypothetical protein
MLLTRKLNPQKNVISTDMPLPPPHFQGLKFLNLGENSRPEILSNSIRDATDVASFWSSHCVPSDKFLAIPYSKNELQAILTRPGVYIVGLRNVSDELIATCLAEKLDTNVYVSNAFFPHPLFRLDCLVVRKDVRKHGLASWLLAWVHRLLHEKENKPVVLLGRFSSVTFKLPKEVVLKTSSQLVYTLQSHHLKQFSYRSVVEMSESQVQEVIQKLKTTEEVRKLWDIILFPTNLHTSMPAQMSSSTSGAAAGSPIPGSASKKSSRNLKTETTGASSSNLTSSGEKEKVSKVPVLTWYSVPTEQHKNVSVIVVVERLRFTTSTSNSAVFKINFCAYRTMSPTSSDIFWPENDGTGVLFLNSIEAVAAHISSENLSNCIFYCPEDIIAEHVDTEGEHVNLWQVEKMLKLRTYVYNYRMPHFGESSVLSPGSSFSF